MSCLTAWWSPSFAAACRGVLPCVHGHGHRDMQGSCTKLSMQFCICVFEAVRFKLGHVSSPLPLFNRGPKHPSRRPQANKHTNARQVLPGARHAPSSLKSKHMHAFIIFLPKLACRVNEDKDL